MTVTYDVYCTNCNTVVTSISSGEFGNNGLGDLLAQLLKDSNEEKLCCYHGDCMVKDYTIRKVAKEMVSLDNADVNVR